MIRCWFARYELAVRDYERLACRAIQALCRGVLERKIIRQDRASDTLLGSGVVWMRRRPRALSWSIIVKNCCRERRSSRMMPWTPIEDTRTPSRRSSSRTRSNRNGPWPSSRPCAALRVPSLREDGLDLQGARKQHRDAIRPERPRHSSASSDDYWRERRRKDAASSRAIAAMVRRKKAEKEAKEQAIARKKAKRENARRALIRFQSAWRAHKARQVYLVKYVQRHACIQFQSLVRRSQAQKQVATLRSKQSEIIERKLQAQAALVFQNCLRRKLARNLLLTKRFVRDDRILAEKTAQAAKAELSRLAQEAEVQRLKDEAEQLEREIREAEENEKKKAEEEPRKLRELKEEAARKAKEKEEQDRRDAMESQLRAEARALIQNNAARNIQRTARGRQLRRGWPGRPSRRKKRDSAEAQNDEAWREWGASIIQAWYRRLVTLQSEANERAWNYWAASIVQTWWLNSWLSPI